MGYYPRELVTAGSIRSTIERAHNLVNECYGDLSTVVLHKAFNVGNCGVRIFVQ